ncbi:hypothetical protein F441_19149 [Phytophthora nicotianae CJ01A1]|uniref:Uncharacterized protein n=2 Tax=Phytophthora nicotianae TaxID=4792 RepID=W2I163_PHYNI|nr:hypothetical protein L915_18753 [Phytophthora nicotianae]ETL27881.1 hypothetical protein L916_18655 [Phytophthora nicotianae]ETL81128.1 hypothetical protein L917_18477 [Phytophthora nicotianae]ETP03964.1 hypothetical protein F441_19149 [Phytophthora nicotianae CJ01A1]
MASTPVQSSPHQLCSGCMSSPSKKIEDVTIQVISMAEFELVADKPQAVERDASTPASVASRDTTEADESLPSKPVPTVWASSVTHPSPSVTVLDLRSPSPVQPLPPSPGRAYIEGNLEWLSKCYASDGYDGEATVY